MRKIFTVILCCAFFQNLSAQCVFDGTDASVTQQEVIDCVNACMPDPCTEIQITGIVNMENAWNLTSLGDITLSILTGGNLVFNGTGTNADRITLTEGSVVLIEDTNPANNAIEVEGGGGGNIRITIGTKTYQGNTFPDIIAAGGANSVDVLPVELTHFEAQSKNDMIELSWTTATELNNDFFQIEHSRDGVQFASIGKVKGVGTTTETVNYDFMHRRPDAGTNYYRLKQVDFDGAFAYSPIVVAEVNTRAGAISLFPNPTVNKVNVLMHHRPEKVTFRLSNLVGQQLDLQPAETDAGWEMDLTRLPRGVYLLRMEYDGKTVTKRLVKE